MRETGAERARNAMDDHDAFERVGAEHRVTTTPFEGRVTASEGEGATGFGVEVQVPTLDAVVEGESVPDVIEEGWLETFELRLADAHQATRRLEALDPEVERDGEEVRVAFAFEESAERGPEEAKALVEYVEGTWVEGIVPGYEYGEPAASLLGRAQQTYGGGGGVER
ncbi:DUF5813 family protein [Natronorarus salvus]|uniref:DUF5813 family protein n=1 Tax=Natronorarus salvus TaxID=3117733 RepID=UPI002F266DFD